MLEFFILVLGFIAVVFAGVVGVLYRTEAIRAHQARLVLQAWADEQGHNKCWYYPDVFSELCRVLDVESKTDPKLPPREEFMQCCAEYAADLYEGQQV